MMKTDFAKAQVVGSKGEDRIVAVERAWPGDNGVGFEVVSTVVEDSPTSNILSHAVTGVSSGSAASEVPSYYLFAIFDGHNGGTAASFAQKTLVPILEAYLPATELLDSMEGAAAWAGALQEALVKTLLEINRRFAALGSPSGTTATIVLQVGQLITCVNVGNSRCILDCGLEVVELTADHVIGRSASERRRLEASGATVAPLDEDGRGPARSAVRGVGAPRVWPGGITLSRTLGDFEAGPAVLPLPSVRQLLLPRGGARIVLGSEALWRAVAVDRSLGDLLAAAPVRAVASRAAGALEERNAQARAKPAYVSVPDISLIVADTLPVGEEVPPGASGWGAGQGGVGPLAEDGGKGGDERRGGRARKGGAEPLGDPGRGDAGDVGDGSPDGAHLLMGGRNPASMARPPLPPPSPPKPTLGAGAVVAGDGAPAPPPPIALPPGGAGDGSPTAPGRGVGRRSPPSVAAAQPVVLTDVDVAAMLGLVPGEGGGGGGGDPAQEAARRGRLATAARETGDEADRAPGSPASGAPLWFEEFVAVELMVALDDPWRVWPLARADRLAREEAARASAAAEAAARAAAAERPSPRVPAATARAGPRAAAPASLDPARPRLPGEAAAWGAAGDAEGDRAAGEPAGGGPAAPASPAASRPTPPDLPAVLPPARPACLPARSLSALETRRSGGPGSEDGEGSPGPEGDAGREALGWYGRSNSIPPSTLRAGLAAAPSSLARPSPGQLGRASQRAGALSRPSPVPGTLGRLSPAPRTARSILKSSSSLSALAALAEGEGSSSGPSPSEALAQAPPGDAGGPERRQPWALTTASPGDRPLSAQAADGDSPSSIKRVSFACDGDGITAAEAARAEAASLGRAMLHGDRGSPRSPGEAPARAASPSPAAAAGAGATGRAPGDFAPGIPAPRASLRRTVSFDASVGRRDGEGAAPGSAVDAEAGPRQASRGRPSGFPGVGTGFSFPSPRRSDSTRAEAALPPPRARTAPPRARLSTHVTAAPLPLAVGPVGGGAYHQLPDPARQPVPYRSSSSRPLRGHDRQASGGAAAPSKPSSRGGQPVRRDPVPDPDFGALVGSPNKVWQSSYAAMASMFTRGKKR